jgi:hypothetical protein
MTASDIQKELRLQTANHVHQLSNVFVHEWEADLFTVTKSGYAYEFEIKVSRSDFLADFKKEKHVIFRAMKKGCCVIPRSLAYTWSDIPELRGQKIPCSHIKTVKISYKTCPNRFYFVCPTNLIDPRELPPYAGLMYAVAGGGLLEIVKAPYIHKEAFQCETMLFSKYFWMAKNLEKEVMILKSRCEQQQEKIKNLQLP